MEPFHDGQAGRRVRAGLLALVVAVGGLGLWLAPGGDDRPATAPSPSAEAPPSSPRSAPAAIPRPAMAKRVETRQARAFAVLRTPPEGVPATVVSPSREVPFGLNTRLAQRLRVAVDGTYWLVPGNGYLCILRVERPGSPGASSCTTSARALTNGIALTTISPRGYERRIIVGAAPDGARLARVHTSGTVAVAPVVRNAFALTDRAADPPDRVTLR